MKSDEGLAWLIRQLWPDGSGVGVVCSTSRIDVADAVECYAVVPGLHRAKFLVPLASRRAAWASVARYNALRPRRLRLARSGLGAAMLSGAGERLVRARLTVSSRAPSEDVLLSEHLRLQLGAPDIAMGIGLHPPDPNAKPTVQLFGHDGRPLGFAKVGWNAATRNLVENEARVLRSLGGTAIPNVHVPALLYAGSWNDRSIAVAAPLPLGVRRHGDPDRLPPLAVNASLATAGGVHVQALRTSAYWHGVRRQADALGRDGGHAKLAAAVAGYVSALEKTWGDEEMCFGTWHGDWVPWNMAWQADTLHVWDWEHSDDGVPLGFDPLHWLFQVALVLRHRPLTDAVSAAAAGQDRLPDLGVPPASTRGVVSLYLLEMFLRTYRLMRDGSGWNPALYPAMIDVLRHRTP